MAFKHEKQLRLLAIHRNLEWPARTILQRFSKFCRSVVYTDDERDKQLAHTHTNTHIHTHTSCEYYSRVRKLVCKCVCVCGVGSVLVRVYAEVSSKLLIVRAFLAYLSCCHLPLPPGTWL